MYCKKCGKFIDGSEDNLCDDCRLNEVSYGTQPQPQQQQSAPAAQNGPSPRMLAFKPALAAVITGVIGYVFMMVAYIYALGSVAAELGELATDIDYGYSYSFAFDPATLLTLAWVFLVMAIPLCVVALVFGIRSLTTVVRAKKAGAPMAIAPLILSICAIGAAALTVIFGLIALGLIASL